MIGCISVLVHTHGDRHLYIPSATCQLGIGEAVVGCYLRAVVIEVLATLGIERVEQPHEDAVAGIGLRELQHATEAYRIGLTDDGHARRTRLTVVRLRVEVGVAVEGSGTAEVKLRLAIDLNILRHEKVLVDDVLAIGDELLVHRTAMRIKVIDVEHIAHGGVGRMGQDTHGVASEAPLAISQLVLQHLLRRSASKGLASVGLRGAIVGHGLEGEAGRGRVAMEFLEAFVYGGYGVATTRGGKPQAQHSEGCATKVFESGHKLVYLVFVYSV